MIRIGYTAVTLTWPVTNFRQDHGPWAGHRHCVIWPNRMTNALWPWRRYPGVRYITLSIKYFISIYYKLFEKCHIIIILYLINIIMYTILKLTIPRIKNFEQIKTIVVRRGQSWNMDCLRFYNIVTNRDTHYQILIWVRIRYNF